MRILDLIYKLDTEAHTGDIVEIDGVRFEVYEKAEGSHYIRRASSPAFDADNFRFCFIIGTLMALSVFADYLFSDKYIPAAQVSALMAGCYAIAIGSWVAVTIGYALVRRAKRRRA